MLLNQSHISFFIYILQDAKLILVFEIAMVYYVPEVFPMSDTLMSATEEVRSKVAKLASEILDDPRMGDLRKLLAGLNTLEDLCGQPKTAMASLFNFGGADKTEVPIEPHEFYGKEPLDAAKRYLKKRGDAGEISAPFGDIVAAIKRGGGDPGNEDRLKVSLARSTWDVAKIGDERFGLLEFFPDIKRGAKKKNGRDKDAASATIAAAPTTEGEREETEVEVKTEEAGK